MMAGNAVAAMPGALGRRSLPLRSRQALLSPFFLVFLAAPALAQGPSSPAASSPRFELRAATTTAALGVPMTLLATVHSPDADRITLDLAASTTDSYAILKAEPAPQQAGGAPGQRVFLVEILPLDIGTIPVRMVWSVRGGTVDSPAFPLQVPEPDMGKEPQIRDIKGIRKARPALWPWLLAAAILAAAYAAWRIWRPKPASLGLGLPPPDDRPPHVIAESELDSLANSGLWEAGRHKEFYIRLTDILRQYLDRRFAVPAMQLTTAELSRDMRRAGIERCVWQPVKELFDRADLVKFARWSPEGGLGARELDTARSIVRETSPRGLAASGAQPSPAQGEKA